MDIFLGPFTLYKCSCDMTYRILRSLSPVPIILPNSKPIWSTVFWTSSPGPVADTHPHSQSALFLYHSSCYDNFFNWSLHLQSLLPLTYRPHYLQNFLLKTQTYLILWLCSKTFRGLPCTYRINLILAP